MKTILTAISIFLVALFITPTLPAQDMWLVWADYGSNGNPIYYSELRGAGWLTAAYPHSGGERTNYMPCLGIDGYGNPWLVWAAQEGTGSARLYFSRKEGDNWSPPRTVGTSPTGWESTPSIVFDRDGRSGIAWAGVAGQSSEIFCARYEDGSFSSPVMVSTPDDSPDARPVISLDDSGLPVITWEGWAGRKEQYFQSSFSGSNWISEQPTGGPAAQGIAAATLADGPLTDTVLAKNGAWLVRRNNRGEWEGTRCREAISPPAALTPDGRAVRGVSSHQYTGYGDSITYGSPNKGECYIPLLKDTLDSSYSGNTYTINNEGYPSTRTYHLLSGGGYKPWKCPGINTVLESYPATKILIMAGTNDIEDGDNYSDIRWNLGEMINRARDHSYEPILATIIPRWDTSVNLTRSEKLNLSYIRPLASEKSVRLADPWQVFIDYGNYGNLYQSDHVHPAWTEGDRKIADAWFPAIPAPSSDSGGGGLDKIIEWAENWASGL